MIDRASELATKYCHGGLTVEEVAEHLRLFEASVRKDERDKWPETYSAEIRFLLTISDVLNWVLTHSCDSNLNPTQVYEFIDRLREREKEIVK